MIDKMIKVSRFRIGLLMLMSSLFSVLLVVYRVHSTGTVTYIFLIWNLILASIPYGITTLLSFNTKIRNSKTLFWSFFFCWLIFLPNAPYIITDMFHLRFTTSFPIWYDLLLIMSFVWNGLLLCYLSISDMQDFIQEQLNSIVAWGVSLFLLLLSGFGIYIGRYLRWNSWDLLNNTQNVFHDITQRVFYPNMHLRTWGVTIGFGVFLILGYLLFKELTKKQFIK